jgi:hypothetical protein
LKFLRSHRREAKLGMTSILNPATAREPPSSSYIARTASHSLIPAAFHPHHGYDHSSRILRHRTFLKNMAPIDLHVISCGHFLLFALSIFYRDESATDDRAFPDPNSNYTVRVG